MIRTAKLHEYEASLLLELDKLAEMFFARKRKTNWQEKKLSLQQQANEMTSSK